MSKYNFDDILLFAVNIEKNGENFYRNFANKFKDETINALFVFLADQEVEHSRYFSELLQSVQTFDTDNGNYNDEYFAYLRAFVDNAIFNQNKNNEISNSINSIVDVLDFALQMESDSITFYSESKLFMNQKDISKVDIIIDEEKKHFRKLYELKSKYNTK